MADWQIRWWSFSGTHDARLCHWRQVAYDSREPRKIALLLAVPRQQRGQGPDVLPPAAFGPCVTFRVCYVLCTINLIIPFPSKCHSAFHSLSNYCTAIQCSAKRSYLARGPRHHRGSGAHVAPKAMLMLATFVCPSALYTFFCQASIIGYGVTANIAASHAAARGSIPRIRILFVFPSPLTTRLESHPAEFRIGQTSGRLPDGENAVNVKISA